MKLLRVVVFLVLLVGVLSSVSNINLSPTGNYPPISTKGGLGVSIAILIYMLFAELGYLPFRFKGRKRRSAVSQLTNPLMLGDRDNILKVNTVCHSEIEHNVLHLSFLCAVNSVDGSPKLPTSFPVRIGRFEARSREEQLAFRSRSRGRFNPSQSGQVCSTSDISQ
jgi:hypothetical protein